jgi:RES domain-containing protein
MITLYRVQADSYRHTILDGIGAEKHGGRWNAKGQPMVYLSTTPELAFLEWMVHLNGMLLSAVPPLVECEVLIPDGCIRFLTVDELPVGWSNQHDPPPTLADFAARQFAKHNCLCLGIPSAVMPVSPSHNVLLNPLHPLRPDCSTTIHDFPIDTRLPTAR